MARLLQLYLTKSYFKSVCVFCANQGETGSLGLSCCFGALLESHLGSHLKQLLLASFIWSLTYTNRYLWWCLLSSQVWLSLAVKEVMNLSESSILLFTLEVGVLNWIVSKGYVEWSCYVEPQCFELSSSIDNSFCLDWHCLLLSICGTHWSSRATWLWSENCYFLYRKGKLFYFFNLELICSISHAVTKGIWCFTAFFRVPLDFF